MNRYTRRLVVFGGLLLWCILLLVFRVARSGTPAYLFLLWNLALAAVPAVAASMLLRESERRRTLGAHALWLLPWLLFLPNAPYVITDFVHLRPRAPVPLWFDLALLISAAATGILLGYTSVADVQTIVRRRAGAALSWLVALTALFVSGFGIYLGRFLRWNSWDLVTSPRANLHYLAVVALHPFAHPRAAGVTAIYGVALVLGYVAFVVMAVDISSGRGALSA